MSEHYHGIINVYKEKGFTSHDVVAKLRGIAGQKKIGHTGTLDPDATGVLPVCLGKGTKLCDMLTDKDKTYEAVLLLGKATDTQDITGTVLKIGDVTGLTEEAVRNVILGFEGAYDQIPPMYSALKVNGKKLYELAREGITVERKARNVTIHKITILQMDLPRVRMEVCCSKGTYIRTLCNDIGEKLGCFGCMEELVRTKVGVFGIQDSLSLADLQKLKDEGRFEEALKSIEEMFPDYPELFVTAEGEPLALNGNEIPIPFVEMKDPDNLRQERSGYYRIYTQAGTFIGVYEKKGKRYRVVKMFYTK